MSGFLAVFMIYEPIRGHNTHFRIHRGAPAFLLSSSSAGAKRGPFIAGYEARFEREYGYFRPVVREVVERYLDCGNPRSGFARIRCPDCHSEHLLTFFCKTRGFCPSCHAKRREEWGQINFHPHLHLLVTEGGMDQAGVFQRLPHLDDSRLAEIFAREVLRLLVGKGLLSPEGAERILSWRHTGFNIHSRVPHFIRHLGLTFVAERPPPAHVFEQMTLIAAEANGEYE